MEIFEQKKDNLTELKISGRLDAYWADHLSKELDRFIKEGAHQIIIDMSDLDYMSSAGIRVLLKYNQILGEMNGFFSISQISQPVKKVLDLIGLSEELLKPEDKKAETVEKSEYLLYENEDCSFKIYSLDSSENKPMECRLIGNPGLINGAQFNEEHCATLSLAPSCYGIGSGGLGRSFTECQNRFGEFITAAGTTAYLPTDDTNVPDFMMTSGTFIPELNVLYGIFFKGDFSTFIRFDVHKETGSIRLSHLCFEILTKLGIKTAGITIIAETEGLVGASLRFSPAGQTTLDFPFSFPHIRKWLSFTSERAFQQDIALITGIIDQNPADELQPFVRSLNDRLSLFGHLHASVFPYQPIKIGLLDIFQTVNFLYETDNLSSVLHLINDDREFSGAGESEFVRGVCWISSISSFVRE